MKRILALVMILMMAVAIAHAEDLTKLSDDELDDLNKRVQLELFRRSVTGEAGVTVPPGMYYVGVDIPAGRYDVSVSDDVSYIEVCIYHAVPLVEGLADYTMLIGTFNGLSQHGVITLVDGDRIETRMYNLIFKAFTGLF